LIGVLGAYFEPIALTLAAAHLSYRIVLHEAGDMPQRAPHSRQGDARWGNGKVAE